METQIDIAAPRESRFFVTSPRFARANFFTADTDEQDVTRWASMMGEESRRVSIDSFLLDRPNPETVRTPLLILGSEADKCLSPGELRATARAYGTKPEVFSGMGHDMMLLPGWAAVAERIDAWLRDRGL